MALRRSCSAAHVLHSALEPNPLPSLSVYARIFGDGAMYRMRMLV